jgi:hypothetical protein
VDDIIFVPIAPADLFYEQNERANRLQARLTPHITVLFDPNDEAFLPVISEAARSFQHLRIGIEANSDGGYVTCSAELRAIYFRETGTWQLLRREAIPLQWTNDGTHCVLYGGARRFLEVVEVPDLAMPGMTICS